PKGHQPSRIFSEVVFTDLVRVRLKRRRKTIKLPVTYSTGKTKVKPKIKSMLKPLIKPD
ncbi:hypothetical protein chiPu_0022132, partial [Chiloscyllium punctatum]|nr:hypothetical protein [Chiloscyllium punctatum]